MTRVEDAVMNVTCPSCSTVFRVDPAKVPAGGVRARCSVCRAVFRIVAQVQPATLEPVQPPAPAAPLPPPLAAAPYAPPPPPTPPTDRGAAPPPFVVPPPAPARPAAASAPAQLTGGTHVRPPFSSRPVSIVAPQSPRVASPRPSVNPFLSKDPSQKARRLARALVSDIVVYHPEKRLEGLRHGTLKQIFDDEIKKSWEEYAAQVGREFAESSSHFNDALNEILGDGSKLF